MALLPPKRSCISLLEGKQVCDPVFRVVVKGVGMEGGMHEALRDLPSGTCGLFISGSSGS